MLFRALGMTLWAFTICVATVATVASVAAVAAVASKVHGDHGHEKSTNRIVDALIVSSFRVNSDSNLVT